MQKPKKRQKQKSLFYEVDHVGNIIPNKRTRPHGRAILGIVFKDICSAASEGSSSWNLGEYAVSTRSDLRSTAEQQRGRHKAFVRYWTAMLTALGWGDRLVRAGRSAGAAVNALVGVDHVGRTLADSLGGASILAATARNALVGSNLVSHFRFSFFVV